MSNKSALESLTEKYLKPISKRRKSDTSASLITSPAASKKQRLQCHHCNAMFDNHRDLSNHLVVVIKKQRQTMKPLECLICNIQFTDKNCLRKHYYKYHTHRPKHKHLKLIRENTLNVNSDSNVNTKESIKQYFCTICKKHCADKHACIIHRLKEHGNIPRYQRVFMGPKNNTNKVPVVKLERIPVNVIKSTSISQTSKSINKITSTSKALTHSESINELREESGTSIKDKGIRNKFNENDDTEKIFNRNEKTKDNMIETETLTDDELTKLYQCDSCKLFYVEFDYIKKHSNNCSGYDISKSFAAKCNKCNISFFYKELEKHNVQHHNNNINEFEFITVLNAKRSKLSKEITTKSNLNEDTKTLKQNVFKCDICGLRFCNKEYFEEHITSQRHGFDKGVRCELCGLKFYYICYVDHIDFHRKEEMYTRKSKNKSIHSEIVNKNVIHDNTLYECKKCKMNFLTERDYVIHIKYEKHNLLKAMCDICDKYFSKNDLAKHLLQHTKPNNSPIRKQEKQSKNTVNETQIEKYDFNNKSYIFNNNIRRYSQAAKINETNTSKKLKLPCRKVQKFIYKCNKCNLHFISLPGLKSHVMNQAHNIKGYDCKICGYKFSSLSLKCHMNIHHKDLKMKRENFLIRDSSIYKPFWYNKFKDKRASSGSESDVNSCKNRDNVDLELNNTENEFSNKIIEDRVETFVKPLKAISNIINGKAISNEYVNNRVIEANISKGNTVCSYKITELLENSPYDENASTVLDTSYSIIESTETAYKETQNRSNATCLSRCSLCRTYVIAKTNTGENVADIICSNCKDLNNTYYHSLCDTQIAKNTTASHENMIASYLSNETNTIDKSLRPVVRTTSDYLMINNKKNVSTNTDKDITNISRNKSNLIREIININKKDVSTNTDQDETDASYQIQLKAGENMREFVEIDTGNTKIKLQFVPYQPNIDDIENLLSVLTTDGEKELTTMADDSLNEEPINPSNSEDLESLPNTNKTVIEPASKINKNMTEILKGIKSICKSGFSEESSNLNTFENNKNVNENVTDIDLSEKAIKNMNEKRYIENLLSVLTTDGEKELTTMTDDSLPVVNEEPINPSNSEDLESLPNTNKTVIEPASKINKNMTELLKYIKSICKSWVSEESSNLNTLENNKNVNENVTDIDLSEKAIKNMNEKGTENRKDTDQQADNPVDKVISDKDTEFLKDINTTCKSWVSEESSNLNTFENNRNVNEKVSNIDLSEKAIKKDTENKKPTRLADNPVDEEISHEDIAKNVPNTNIITEPIFIDESDDETSDCVTQNVTYIVVSDDEDDLTDSCQIIEVKEETINYLKKSPKQSFNMQPNNASPHSTNALTSDKSIIPKVEEENVVDNNYATVKILNKQCGKKSNNINAMIADNISIHSSNTNSGEVSVTKTEKDIDVTTNNAINKDVNNASNKQSSEESINNGKTANSHRNTNAVIIKLSNIKNESRGSSPIVKHEQDTIKLTTNAEELQDNGDIKSEVESDITVKIEEVSERK